MYIHREIEGRLTAAVRQFPAVAVTGPRQSGKSTLLKKLFAGSHKYATFDDPIIRERAILDPRLFLEELGARFILDEIQYVPQILSYVKLLIDEKRKTKGRFLFTGSQQFHLIKNLGNSLAGRICLFELLPFSAEEKKKIPLLGRKLSNTTRLFINACLRGSYPELCIEGRMKFDAWCGAYLQTYLERDVRTIFDIGNLRDFQRFIQILASRCAQVLNLSSFASDLGVSVNTVKKWLSVLEASRIVYLLNPYYQNLGKRITKAPKVYFIDCGLVCYLVGIKDEGLLLNGPMAGALFENFCVQEALKVLFNYGGGFRLYYLRTQNNLEVDLLIERNTKLYPCEIKFTKTLKGNMAEPIERFKRIFNKLPIAKGKIISLSEDEFSLTKDISAVNPAGFFNWLKG